MKCSHCNSTAIKRAERYNECLSCGNTWAKDNRINKFWRMNAKTHAFVTKSNVFDHEPTEEDIIEFWDQSINNKYVEISVELFWKYKT